MDFSNRNSQPQPVAPNTHQAAPASPVSNSNRRGVKNLGSGNAWNIVTVILGACIVILIVAVIALISFNQTSQENKYVDSNRLQAVFLNTGQVYFGNIKSLNNKYFVLDNIYYLQTSSTGKTTTATAANTSVSLVKLGCELHAPYDQMVISAPQVTFWENLQPSGQVAKAVAAFQQKNPSGQKCSDQSAAPAGASSSNGVQGTTPSGVSAQTSTPTLPARP